MAQGSAGPNAAVSPMQKKVRGARGSRGSGVTHIRGHAALDVRTRNKGSMLLVGESSTIGGSLTTDDWCYETFVEILPSTRVHLNMQVLQLQPFPFTWPSILNSIVGPFRGNVIPNFSAACEGSYHGAFCGLADSLTETW
jgi:hypothetical protein